MRSDFTRVLVANRGEIALRIVRAVRDAGLASIAVYAEPDRRAAYVRLADEAVALDASTGGQPYLDIEAILAAAEESGADAVHPGYGFLSENADFARAVITAGLVWIGPPPEVIEALGDKVRARAIAADVGAPLAPGTAEPCADAEEALAFVREHGLPVAIKAAHGGGGRGLRVARTEDEVAELFEAAVREATAAFGRGECFVEVYVEHARHVEVQVLADTQGTVRALGTRDCTLQRRYQKLVEEAPAPYLTDEQHRTVTASASAICRRAGYIGAATVEFLLAPTGMLAFLEVNTRLQVEHAVTEETTDVDIVRAQLRIAAGEPLDADVCTDDHGVVRARRHALELRINAEDPATGFLPSTGTITRLTVPGGPGVRLDSGVEVGSEVSAAYDSLLAKLVITGSDRAETLERARRALAELEIEGVSTTLPFHRRVLVDPAFAGPRAADFAVHTRWIEQEFAAVLAADPVAAQGDDVDRGQVRVRIGNRWLRVDLPALANPRQESLVRVRDEARERLDQAEPGGDGEIRSPMQGTVVRVAVGDGDDVDPGQLLVVIEAMKMENPVRSTLAGRVSGLGVAVGDTVTQGQRLGSVSAPAEALAPL